MLSRILRDDRKDTAQPLPWKRAGGKLIPATADTRATIAPLGTVTSAGPVSVAAQEQEHSLQTQVAALQRKVVEAEAANERRIKEIREAAFREGEAAGRNQAAAQVQPVLDKLAQSIRQI